MSQNSVKPQTLQITESQWLAIAEQTKQATGFTMEQIKAQQNYKGEIEPAGNDSYELKAEALNAIKQKSSRGLTVIDINPQQITRIGNECIYDTPVLNEIVGNNLCPPGFIMDSIFTDPPTSRPKAYWRTIFIPIQGNFLRTEYLQAQVNLDLGQNSLINGVIQDAIPKNFENPQGFSDTPGLVDTFDVSGKISGDRVILIDFNTNTQSPLIAKDNDTFRTYFDGILVSFKQNSPRIRLTVGFNSSHVSNYQKPETLELWSGPGLRQNPSTHPVPFCINDFDTENVETGISLGAAGVITRRCLVANPIPSSLTVAVGAAPIRWMQRGLGIFWITGFSFNLNAVNADNFTVGLYVGDLGTEATNFLTGMVQRKRLYSTNINAASTSNPSGIPRPIRVVLRETQGLFLRVSHTTGANVMAGFFSVFGYSYGPLWSKAVARSEVGAVKTAPFYFRHKLTYNPYPIDLDDLNQPGL